MVAEVTVICKGEDRTYRQKFLEYPNDKGPLSFDRSCPILGELVKEAVANFTMSGENPETIIVKAEMAW